MTRYWLSRKIAALVLFGICLGQISFAAGPSAPHIRNFGRVNDHLYRGGQPTAVGLEELGALGVKRVVSLEGAGESIGIEEKQLKKLGVEYINISLPAFSAPSSKDVRSILQLLINSNTPTYLHCRRGKDRTGTIVACYRIQHDGWDNRRALDEARAFGMSRLERGMQSFVLHFSSLPGLLVQPEP